MTVIEPIASIHALNKSQHAIVQPVSGLLAGDTDGPGSEVGFPFSVRLKCLCCVAGDESVTSQLSALLLRTLDFLGGLSCRAWANHHVWTHVTKHYVTTLKELCEDAVRKLCNFIVRVL